MTLQLTKQAKARLIILTPFLNRGKLADPYSNTKFEFHVGETPLIFADWSIQMKLVIMKASIMTITAP